LAQVEAEARGGPGATKRLAHAIVAPALNERIVPVVGVNRKNDSGMIAVPAAHIGEVDSEFVPRKRTYQKFEIADGIRKTGHIGKNLTCTFQNRAIAVKIGQVKQRTDGFFAHTAKC